ncbi:MAG: hypothetical protein RR397_01035 [Odoribacter sp.]
MLLFKMILIVATLFTSNGQWQRVNTSEQISFLLPNHPQKIQKLINGIPSTIYQTKDLTCVAGVVCSDLSAKKIKMTIEYAQLLYEELKKESINIKSAILKNERTIPYENMLIKEIEYSIIKGDYEMTYFKRFIFRDNYIYQISIGGRTRHTEIIQEEKEIFFNSISFQTTTPSENTEK